MLEGQRVLRPPAGTVPRPSLRAILGLSHLGAGKGAQGDPEPWATHQLTVMDWKMQQLQREQTQQSNRQARLEDKGVAVGRNDGWRLEREKQKQRKPG